MRRLLQIVTTWEWLLLLTLLPLLFFSTAAWALPFLLIPAFWLVRKVATGRFFPPTPYNISLLFLGLSLLISLFAVFDLILSLPKIGGLVFGIALYFAGVEQCRQRKNGLWLVLAVVIAAGTAMAIAAIPFSRWPEPVQFLNAASDYLPQRFSSLPGAADGVINLNELAGVLTWIVPLLGAVTFGYGRRLWQSERLTHKLSLILLLLAFLFTSFVLLASGSRGGIASVFIALLLMLAINYAWGRWLLLAGIVGVIALVIFFGQDLLLTSPSDAAEQLGFQARMEIWSRGLEAVEEFPLTGVGMNGFRVLVRSFYPLTLISPSTDIGHAHSHLLQAALDLGIPGLIAYSSIWTISAGLLWDGLRRESLAASGYRPLLSGLSGSLAAFWIFGIVDAIALGARPGFIWWLLLALISAAYTAVYQSSAEAKINVPEITGAAAANQHQVG
jgi:putative inorganic carbon (HCO3(-)) transporter